MSHLHSLHATGGGFSSNLSLAFLGPGQPGGLLLGGTSLLGFPVERKDSEITNK